VFENIAFYCEKAHDEMLTFAEAGISEQIEDEK
jgi:hypothetical protein